jgi:hypothetical protein
MARGDSAGAHAWREGHSSPRAQAVWVMPPKDATGKHENGGSSSGKANSSKSSVRSQLIAGMQLVALERKHTAGAEREKRT